MENNTAMVQVSECVAEWGCKDLSTPRLERNNMKRLSLLGFQTPCLLTELGAGVDVGSSKTS